MHSGSHGGAIFKSPPPIALSFRAWSFACTNFARHCPGPRSRRTALGRFAFGSRRFWSFPTFRHGFKSLVRVAPYRSRHWTRWMRGENIFEPMCFSIELGVIIHGQGSESSFPHGCGGLRSDCRSRSGSKRMVRPYRGRQRDGLRPARRHAHRSCFRRRYHTPRTGVQKLPHHCDRTPAGVRECKGRDDFHIQGHDRRTFLSLWSDFRSCEAFGGACRRTASGDLDAVRVPSRSPDIRTRGIFAAEKRSRRSRRDEKQSIPSERRGRALHRFVGSP